MERTVSLFLFVRGNGKDSQSISTMRGNDNSRQSIPIMKGNEKSVHER